MKPHRVFLTAAAFLLALSLPVPAFAQTATNTTIWGNNDPRFSGGTLYVSARGRTLRTSQSGGKMRVETVLTGYHPGFRCGSATIYTGLGAPPKEGVWSSTLGACYNEYTGSDVYAEHYIYNEVPFGNYTGLSHHWFIASNGAWSSLGNTSASRFFADPQQNTCETDPTQSGCPNTPIIVRLQPEGADQDADTARDKGRNDYRLTGAGQGVSFDIDGNGTIEQIGWTARGSKLAFLAIDRNGNGAIDNGAELFGNNTVQGVGNGFAALRVLAQAGQELDSLDVTSPIWSRLLLWEDANHDGASQADELQPASNVLTKIGLGYSLDVREIGGQQVIEARTDAYGNLFQYRGWVEYREGVVHSNARTATQRAVYDVVLTTK